MAHFMLFGMGPETQFINPVDNLTQVVTTLNPILQLTENLTNLVLNSISTFSFSLEFL
jgi:hypothetical protein